MHCSTMSVQTTFFGHHVPYTTPPKIHSKLAFPPKLEAGFSNSAKRVPGTRISLKNGGDLVVVRSNNEQQAELKEQEEDEHDDGFYMRRCVELARKAVGHTSPNPMVGCVIVKDGNIVGEGFHPKAGQPHAEVFGLRNAGYLAENATAYVSLEPCNHYGRTPPCTEALIKVKVKKVVIGMVDPNPIVASTGVKKLQDAGIEVKVGVEEELCKNLNEAYIHQMLTGKPFVALRYSISVNGHILNQLGEEASKSGGYYSKLLQEYDAVIISSTSLTDESSFRESNEPGANQPLHVILSRNPSSKIHVPDATTKAIIFSEKEMTVKPETDQKGIEMVSFDRVSLDAVLHHCKSQGLCSVLLDLTGDFAEFEDVLKEGFEQNLFQKVFVEVLPVWSGSEEKVLKHVDVEVKMKKMTSRVVGSSVLLEGYF